MRDTYLTLDAAAQVCPSILTDHPAPGVSDKYSFLPTHRVLNAAIDAGWRIHSAREQAKERRVEMRPFAAHRVILRHPDVSDETQGCHFQVIMLNSHDRSRRLSLSCGLDRLVCSNGLTVSIASVARITTLHLQGRLDPAKVIESMSLISKEAPAVFSRVRTYEKVELTPHDQQVFAERCLAARYGNYPPTVSLNAVLTPRRKLDEGNQLWRVFNRVQENIIKGCQDGKHCSKPVTSLTEQVIVNRKLWQIMEDYATVAKN